MTKNTEKIACVVVTYNRLALLKECISGLKNQTKNDFDIIVVDNGSNDGTGEWLSEQPDLIVISQGNYGGAGGFYSGTKYAYDNGYEWILMMDDDGMPDKNLLINLLQGAKEQDAYLVNALVCDKDDNEKLAFGLVHNSDVLRTVQSAQQYSVIPYSIAPFNGTLINRCIIDKVGLIKKEMFIWGDEVEYVSRISKAGFKRFTITNALHYHPKARNTYLRVLPFSDKFMIQKPSKERAPIVYRNMGYNCRYGRLRGLLWISLMYSVYHLIRLDFVGLCVFWKYFIHGLNNKYPEVDIKINNIKEKQL